MFKQIDLNGENGSSVIDLSKPMEINEQYDLVTDFGTSEHVEKSLYNCWANKFNLCKTGGFILSENPKTGNWKGHGFHYYTLEFYEKLAEVCPSLELLFVGETPAHGNSIDGWNVYCLFRKVGESWISAEQFKTLDIRKK